jgi:hydrogenase 3 maturation protease
LAVLGVGSELRGDDFAGVLVARKVQAWAQRSRIEYVAGFEGCAAPENLTGAVARFKPSHVLLVDAAHLGKEPGTVELLVGEKITGVSFSTHMLPAPIVLDYLKKSCGCQAMVLGIQPQQTDVMGPISDPVAAAIEAIVATVAEISTGRKTTKFEASSS